MSLLSMLVFCSKSACSHGFISFVHSRMFDVSHTGDRTIVTLKRTVDSTWIPEQQAFILTRESSLSSFKFSEALGDLESISSIFLLRIFLEVRLLTQLLRIVVICFGSEISPFKS